MMKTAPNILIVDDLATNRVLVRTMLEPDNFHIDEAATGEEALEKVAANEFDVILLDVMLPGIDGLQFCRKLRQELQQTLLPVIMLTALNSSEDIVKGLAAGATDYITKPFVAAELTARINAAINHKHLTDRLDDTESVLFALARTVEAKDKTTGDHCDRLAHMSQIFGRTLRLSDEALHCLRRGGVLHDIGKLGIPDSILMKKGKLTDAEWVVMRQHTVIGEQLCLPLKSMRGTVDIVRSHHEKWNGSGYPDGLKGEEIPLLARVFQIVDIFDALSSVRPYKKAFPLEKAIDIMESETKKKYWDKELMAEFLNIARTRHDELIISEPTVTNDRSQQIFAQIQNTGVLDWNEEETRTTKQSS